MSRATRRRSARDEEPEREDAPVQAPDAGVADLLRLQRTAGKEGFTKEFRKARVNAGGMPKSRKGDPGGQRAMRESANAVIPKSEKQVKVATGGKSLPKRKP